MVSIQSHLEKTEEVTSLRRDILQYRRVTEELTTKYEKQRRELKEERLSNLRLRGDLEKARRGEDCGNCNDEKCELLAQQCEVSKKERADALDAQERLTQQCFNVERENEALRKSVEELKLRITELEKIVDRQTEQLQCAQQEMRESQEKRDWALEAHQKTLRQCVEAQNVCAELRIARDQAINKQIDAVKKLDVLKSCIEDTSCESGQSPNNWRMLCQKFEELIAVANRWLMKEHACTSLGGMCEESSRQCQCAEHIEEGKKSSHLKGTQSLPTMKQDAVACLKKSVDCNGKTWDKWIVTISEDSGVMSAIEWQTLPIVTGLKHEAINSDLSLGDVVLEVNGISTKNVTAFTFQQLLNSHKSACSLSVQNHWKVPVQLTRDIGFLANELQLIMTKLSSDWAIVKKRNIADLDLSSFTASIGQWSSQNEHISKSAVLSRSVPLSAMSPSHSGGEQKATQVSSLSGDSEVGLSEFELHCCEVHTSPQDVKSVKNVCSSTARNAGTHHKSTKTRISTELQNELRRFKLNSRKVLNDISKESTESQNHGEVKRDWTDDSVPCVYTDSKSLLDGCRLARSRQLDSGRKYFSWSVPKSYEGQLKHWPAPNSLLKRAATVNDGLGLYSSECSVGDSVGNTIPSGGFGRVQLAQNRQYLRTISSGATMSVNSKTVCWKRDVVVEKRDGTLGFMIQGGNKTGIFVSELRPGYEAGSGGVQAGDEILQVGDQSLDGLTREAAAVLLRSVGTRARLVVQQNLQKFLQLPHYCDSLYLRCLTSYKACHPAEMDFNEGHILHVVDTVVNHPPNCWLALNLSVDSSDRQPKVIPNLKRSLENWQGQKMYEQIDFRVV